MYKYTTLQYNGVARETLALPYPLAPNVKGSLGPTEWGSQLLGFNNITSAEQKLSRGVRALRLVTCVHTMQCNTVQ